IISHFCCFRHSFDTTRNTCPVSKLWLYGTAAVGPRGNAAVWCIGHRCTTVIHLAALRRPWLGEGASVSGVFGRAGHCSRLLFFYNSSAQTLRTAQARDVRSVTVARRGKIAAYSSRRWAPAGTATPGESF